ncbi:3-(3-hydroxy-phenyl)propionate transporter MhpT [Burkholderia sp. BCC1998]|uniref:3-(3-hydroxy-phenyl)propionate transporter MhpT n=1 Tax=Burkholderia sp. BCC1998 TaxID=2817447 RepID=UPI002AB64729|nr:3-(3-hydroxy-phenyl)propionate transporter MhpT [Burkholderia sp. BCC1998]
MKTSKHGHAGGARTIGLCLLVALLEGLDLQSAGIAAPRMAHEFVLGAAQMAWAFGIGALGLLPGAALGGRLADRLGRKHVLMVSVALFGVFSLATTQVWSFESLLAARFVTGLGLGAAMPNLIALCSEAALPQQRSTAVGAMYCGMPFGAALGAAIGVISTEPAGWRHVFYVGGIGPLLVLPLLALWLNESAQFVETRTDRAQAADASVAHALWGESRAATTAALWASYLGTLVVLYFLMNWLPSMVMMRGLTHAQSSFVQVMFNVGGGLGAIGIASLMDRIGRRPTVVGMYVGIVCALALMTGARDAAWLAGGALMCGMFLIGAQSVLYALASAIYPTRMRGTGVGAAVAVGRVGSILGPFVAGQLLALGESTTMLMASSIPLVVVAALSALTVVARNRAGGPVLAAE